MDNFQSMDELFRESERLDKLIYAEIKRKNPNRLYLKKLLETSLSFKSEIIKTHLETNHVK